MDEHRIGLKPVLRRVWTPRGQRRIAPVRPRYQGQYLYGFVCPATGQTEWWLGSTVDMALFGAILATWADTVGASVTTPVVLVLDGAGWHRSLRLVVPPGGHLVFLPPYSPEL